MANNRIEKFDVIRVPGRTGEYLCIEVHYPLLYVPKGDDDSEPFYVRDCTLVRKATKYVVIAAKKMQSGSRVMCGQCSEAEAEATMKKFELDPEWKTYAPFSVITVEAAEKRKMYGKD